MTALRWSGNYFFATLCIFLFSHLSLQAAEDKEVTSLYWDEEAAGMLHHIADQQLRTCLETYLSCPTKPVTLSISAVEEFRGLRKFAQFIENITVAFDTPTRLTESFLVEISYLTSLRSLTLDRAKLNYITMINFCNDLSLKEKPKPALTSISFFSPERDDGYSEPWEMKLNGGALWKSFCFLHEKSNRSGEANGKPRIL